MRRLLTIVVTLGLLSTGTACSVDTASDNADSGTSSNGSPSASSRDTAGADTYARPAPIKADDSKKPVTIGFHNTEGGAVSLPEVREGFEAGVNYVNAELGGINGSPLRVNYCNVDASPEGSVNCANKFVTQGVVAAVQGADFAADAALPILQKAGIAEIGFFPFSSAVDHAVGSSFFWYLSSEANYAADPVVMHSLGAKNEAMVLWDQPQAHEIFDKVVKPAAEKLDMKVTAYYYPNSGADWTTLAASIAATSPDAIGFPVGTEQTCAEAIPALRNAGFTGMIHATACSDSIEQLPKAMRTNLVVHAEMWYPNFTDIPAKPRSDIDKYLEYTKKVNPDFKSYLYTEIGFATAVQAADMLRNVKGEVNAGTVLKTLPTATGPLFFREENQKYDCGQPSWPGTTGCTSSFYFAKVNPDNSRTMLPDQPIDVASMRPGS